MKFTIGTIDNLTQFVVLSPHRGEYCSFFVVCVCGGGGVCVCVCVFRLFRGSGSG